MRFPFSARRRSELSMDTAEHMLSNVFTACGHDQNTVPLETLISYSNYRKERYSIQRTVIVLMLAVFLLIPLLFIAAGIRVNPAAQNADANPVYAVSVSTRIPIRQIQASMEGRNVPIYEISPGEYMVQPRSNGEMNISVTLLNRQLTSVDVLVDSVDTDAPKLVSTEARADRIVFYLSDTGSGVDFENVTFSDPSGNVSPALGFDAAAGCVFLPYPDCPLNVRIPDMRGNVLQVDLKPQGQ